MLICRDLYDGWRYRHPRECTDRLLPVYDLPGDSDGRSTP